MTKLNRKQKKHIETYPKAYQSEILFDLKQSVYNTLYERTSTLIQKQFSAFNDDKTKTITYKLRRMQIDRNQRKLFKMAKELKENRKKLK